MKRFFLPFLPFLATLAFPSADAASYAVKNLDLNGGGASFARDLTVSSSGSDLYVRTFVTPLSGFERRHKVTLSGMPSGVSAISYSTANSDCSSFSNVSITSGGFSYEFPGNCDGVVAARYRTAGIADGTYTLSAIVTDCGVNGVCGDGDDSSSSTNTATVTVSSKAVLVRAVTLDLDGDGFLDAYDLYWNRIPALPLAAGQIRARVDSRFASSVSYSAGSGARGTISFGDGFFSSGEIPRIEIDGDANYQSGSYYIGVSEDGAAPSATPSKTPGTYTGTVSLAFSLSESGTIRYAFGIGAANAASPVYSSPISFSSPTVVSTYSTDLAGNSRTQNFAYAFSCSVSAPTNGSVSAYPACVVSCNVGYVLSGGVCVVYGGGSSGGWSSSGGSSGGSSSGGSSGGGSSSGGATGVPSQPQASNNPATISSSTADLFYFASLSGALSYLDLRILNADVKSAFVKSAIEIGIDDSAYYLGFDSVLKKEYNRAINAFVLFFVLSDKAKTFALTDMEKSEYAWAESVLAGAKSWTKKIAERYVSTYKYPTGATVYRTNYEPIKLVMSKLEKRYVGKFNLLLSSSTIDRKTYLSAIDGWNRFVLHLSVFRTYGRLEASKTRAIAGITLFEPIYKKRVRTVVVPVVAEIPTSPTVAVPFPKDVSYGQTSDDVRRLQQMLKDAGYFGTLSPTGYFWPSTKGFLTRFSEEVLKIPNPEGIFSGKVREATNAYLVR